MSHSTGREQDGSLWLSRVRFPALRVIDDFQEAIPWFNMTVRGVNVVGGQLYDVGAHGSRYEGRSAQGVQMEFGVQWIRFLKKKRIVKDVSD